MASQPTARLAQLVSSLSAPSGTPSQAQPQSSLGKKKVGLLGATGTVGQRFILLLAHHPHFAIHVLGASASSAGKTYEQATAGRWKQVHPIPEHVRRMQVGGCEVERFRECDVVFSGLDSGPAAQYGELLLHEGVRM